MREVFPSHALRRQASWLYSMILFSALTTLMNSTILSRSFREARRAGLNTTISSPNATAKQAEKMAILRTRACRDARPCIGVRNQDARECLAETTRGANEYFRIAASPSVLLHYERLVLGPVLLVYHPRRGAHESLVEFQLVPVSRISGEG